MRAFGISGSGEAPMRHQKLSSAEDEKGDEVMNVEVDREHYEKLLILSAVWKRGTPARRVEGFVEEMWAQIDEAIPDDLTLEDFKEVADYLRGA